MIRIGTIAALLAASALGTTAALAQEAPQAPAPASQSAPPSEPAPASPPAAATAAPAAASFTDTDVDQFASAALAVQEIQKDTSVADADKQAKMASAVTSSGLSAEKFNAIATASQSDPALMKRIQLAAASKIKAPTAAPGGDATGSDSTSSATPPSGANR